MLYIRLGFGQWARNSTYYKMLRKASELVGSCEFSNEPLGNVKCGEFLD